MESWYFTRWFALLLPPVACEDAGAAAVAMLVELLVALLLVSTVFRMDRGGWAAEAIHTLIQKRKKITQVHFLKKSRERERNQII